MLIPNFSFYIFVQTNFFYYLNLISSIFLWGTRQTFTNKNKDQLVLYPVYIRKKMGLKDSGGVSYDTKIFTKKTFVIAYLPLKNVEYGVKNNILSE